MLVIVRPLRGSSFEIEVAEHVEVGHLKQLIATALHEQARSSQLRLIFNGNILPDAGTLHEHGLKDAASVVALFLRNRRQRRQQAESDDYALVDSQPQEHAQRVQLHGQADNPHTERMEISSDANLRFGERPGWPDRESSPTPAGYVGQENNYNVGQENNYSLECKCSLGQLELHTQIMPNIFNKKKLEATSKECIICHLEFEPEQDGGALPCASGHIMCGDCSAVYVSSALASPFENLPPKCSLCRGEIAQHRFEAVLSDEQCEQYLTWLAMTTLGAGERLVFCTRCTYFEVRVDTPNFFFCSRCGEGHCFFCKASLPTVSLDDDDDGFEDGSKQDEISDHFKCADLVEHKTLIEEALDAGAKMACPGCGLSGQKDDACTHMTCNGCGCKWCYCCGLAEADCDKAPGGSADDVDPIYLHNEDWDTNAMRCPMYLSQIGELDIDWPADDESCVSRFHWLRTIKLLQKAVKTMGVQKFQGLCDRFPSVRNCGFSLMEIQGTDTTLFHRRSADEDE